MELPRGGTSPDEVGDPSMLALIRASFVTNGIVFRALVELGKTPKPWPQNVKRARNALLALQTHNLEAYRAIPASLREAAAIWATSKD